VSLWLSHPGEPALVLAAAAEPLDDAPRLVLADWLDERGEAHTLRPSIDQPAARRVVLGIAGDPRRRAPVPGESSYPRPGFSRSPAYRHHSRIDSAPVAGHRRGMVEYVRMTRARFMEVAADLARLPIGIVELVDLRPGVQRRAMGEHGEPARDVVYSDAGRFDWRPAGNFVAAMGRPPADVLPACVFEQIDPKYRDTGMTCAIGPDPYLWKWEISRAAVRHLRSLNRWRPLDSAEFDAIETAWTGMPGSKVADDRPRDLDLNPQPVAELVDHFGRPYFGRAFLPFFPTRRLSHARTEGQIANSPLEHVLDLAHALQESIAVGMSIPSYLIERVGYDEADIVEDEIVRMAAEPGHRPPPGEEVNGLIGALAAVLSHLPTDQRGPSTLRLSRDGVRLDRRTFDDFPLWNDDDDPT
jgi:uncharacterized protein (TIGR02996 family)